jgi:hypothetical protein
MTPRRLAVTVAQEVAEPVAGEAVADDGMDPQAILSVLLATGLEDMGECLAWIDALGRTSDPAMANALLRTLGPLRIGGGYGHPARLEPADGNPWLTALPEGLVVDGILYAKAVPLLERTGSIRARSVWLSDCTNLKTLGAIQVKRELILTGCTVLVSLPPVMKVGRHLDLKGCTAWDGVVPEGVEVGGLIRTDAFPKGLLLADYRDIQRGLPAEADLAHSAEVGLRNALDGGVGLGIALDAMVSRFGREATLEGLVRLEGVTLAGGFDFRGREWVDRLPRNFTVKGNLVLYRHVDSGPDKRSILKALPEGLTVTGNLTMPHSDLERVGANLKVGGTLMLASCRRFTGFDGPATIGGDLSVVGCPRLVAWPEDLRVQGTIWAEGKLPKPPASCGHKAYR